MHLKHTNQLKDPKMGAAVVKQYFKIWKNLCSHRIMTPGASEGNDEGKSETQIHRLNVTSVL